RWPRRPSTPRKPGAVRMRVAGTGVTGLIGRTVTGREQEPIRRMRRPASQEAAPRPTTGPANVSEHGSRSTQRHSRMEMTRHDGGQQQAGERRTARPDAPADRLRPAPPPLDHRLLAAGADRGRGRGRPGTATAVLRLLAAGPAGLPDRPGDPARVR